MPTLTLSDVVKGPLTDDVLAAFALGAATGLTLATLTDAESQRAAIAQLCRAAYADAGLSPHPLYDFKLVWDEKPKP